MDKRLIKLIERAVHSTATRFPLNAGWRELHREYNIGLTEGNNIQLFPRDKHELIDLVKQVTGLDLRVNSADRFATATRSEAVTRIHDEKWAGRKVSAGRLAMKALPGKHLSINGQALCLPSRSHLDIAIESITSLEHETLLVIENYECFDRLEQMRWNLGECHSDPLVLYRGDPQTSSAKAVNELLLSLKRGVLAMVDLDPAGLLIAQSLPGVQGLVAPAAMTLETWFERGNPELYHRQRPSAEQAVSNSPHRAIRTFWQMIERHQKGLVQEHWLDSGVELHIHDFQ